MQTRAHRRVGTWLALVGVVLYALWPLLATAQPRTSGGQYELCPHVWMHKFSEEAHHEKHSSNPIWNDHQLQCAFAPGAGEGASPLPVLAEPSPVFTVWQTTAAVHAIVLPRFTPRFLAATPRGPPAVS